jgi:hypothetical protein
MLALLAFWIQQIMALFPYPKCVSLDTGKVFNIADRKKVHECNKKRFTATNSSIRNISYNYYASIGF